MDWVKNSFSVLYQHEYHAHAKKTLNRLLIQKYLEIHQVNILKIYILSFIKNLVSGSKPGGKDHQGLVG